MPDSNNNQEPVVKEDFVRKVDVKVLVAVVALVFLAVYFVVTFSQRMNSGNDVPTTLPESVTDIEVAVTTPTDNTQAFNRSDFGTEIPPGIPEAIPVATGEGVTQSYTLQYDAGKQSTSVFDSPLTVEENFSKYSAILEKEGWAIKNEYESASISSLYGLKETSEINVTISNSRNESSGSSSQVSVSVLNK